MKSTGNRDTFAIGSVLVFDALLKIIKIFLIYCGGLNAALYT